jgi:site-specific DNA recombinase
MAKELNNRGYKSKAGKPFTKNSFSSILTQEKYVGTYTWNKARKKSNKGTRNSHKHKPTEQQVIIKDAIPAIISKEQFDRVQAMIASRKNGTSSSKSRRYYLLSGIGKLRCSECGAYLVGTARKSHGIEYIYYNCPNHKRHTCSVKEIRADYLNDFVVKAVVKDIYSREDLADIFNSADEENRIKRLNDKLRGLEKSTRNILMALRDGYSSDLSKELKSISEEKEAITLEISKLTKKQLLMTGENRKTICYKITKMMLSSESLEVKQYLAHVIDSIVVSNDSVELILNIA